MKNPLNPSEIDLKEILGAVSDAFFLITHDNTIIDFSSTREELNLPRELLIGKKITEIFPQEQEKIPYNAIRRTINDKQPQIIRVDLTIQGIQKFFEISIINLTKVIVAILVRDLTKPKELLSKIINTIPDLSFLIKNDTTIIEFTGKESYLYLPPKEFLGRKLLDVMPQDLHDKIENVVNEIVANKQSQVLEYDLPIQNRRCHYKALFAYIDDDKISVMIKEIIEKQELYQKMKKSQERFIVAANHTTIGIVIVQDKKCVYVNNAFTQILEHSKNEIYSWGFNDFLQLIDEDDKKKLSEWVEEMESGKENFVPHISYLVKTKSGLIVKGYHFSKIIIWNKEFADLIAIFDKNDNAEILELKKNHQKFFIEFEQLQNDFLNRLSHELKTPLTSIFSASEFLLNHYREIIEEDVIMFLEIIYRGGNRLKNLIENFITTSSLDLNKIKLEKEPIDIIKVITSCIEDLDPLIQERNLFIETILPEKLILNLDEKRIREIIVNVIVNALNNTPKKGKISINLREHRDYIDIFIKDTGVGLTKKELHNIFKKFGKIERYGKDMDVNIEGPGLGLYISKKLVDLHHGEIRAESEGRNKGSTFIIQLPK